MLFITTLGMQQNKRASLISLETLYAHFGFAVFFPAATDSNIVPAVLQGGLKCHPVYEFVQLIFESVTKWCSVASISTVQVFGVSVSILGFS